jgi:tetrahydromethanopterin S-methyltransferase subunit H
MKTEQAIIDASKEENWLERAKEMHDKNLRPRVINVTRADEEAIYAFLDYKASKAPKQKPFDGTFTIEF